MDVHLNGHCKTRDNNRVEYADDGSNEDPDIKLGPGEKVKIYCYHLSISCIQGLRQANVYPHGTFSKICS